MRAIFHMFGRTPRAPCLLLGAALALGACVREHTVFERAGNGGEAGAAADGGVGATLGVGASGFGGKAPGGPDKPWDEASCLAALSQGKTGDACVGLFKCSATANCCQIVAVCEGAPLSVKSSCDDCVASCTGDADCGFGRLCEAYECRNCPTGPCPPTWLSISRNGCSVCVPPSECKMNKDGSCAEGEACVAGLSCLPGCKGDPACCFGNRCAPVKCQSPHNADCLEVGCPAGSTCKVVSEAVACKCDATSGEWSCEQPVLNTCIADDKP